MSTDREPLRFAVDAPLGEISGIAAGLRGCKGVDIHFDNDEDNDSTDCGVGGDANSDGNSAGNHHGGQQSVRL